ncbi:MAG: hypothetical protein P8L37_09115 [Phycisphaerales bacterium]|nr:hypothetical protein [Phycisphaerales bacterium]
MLNTPTNNTAMMDEAERSKERVRQLLSIQIEAQLAMNEGVDDADKTWTDHSYHGEFEAIGN